MKLIRAALTAITIATLSACGGGGGDAAPAPPGPVTVAMPEGIYGGTTTYPSAFQMLVLENGEYWAVYGTDTPEGFVQGTLSNVGGLASADAKDFLGAAPARAAVLDAVTYTSQQRTLDGSIRTADGSVVFHGGPMLGTSYNYDQAPSLSTITGTWVLAATSNESVLLNVNASGAFTARSSGGCNFSGTVAPRASGKNVFDVNFTFGPAPCGLPGQAARGVAIAYPLDDNRTQLVVAVTNASRTHGLAAGAYRANS